MPIYVRVAEMFRKLFLLPYLLLFFLRLVCLNDGGLGLKSDYSRFSALIQKWEVDGWCLATNLCQDISDLIIHDSFMALVSLFFICF